MRAGGIEFGVLTAGSGPLALCLHGFPDTAHTWRHLLPALADAGYRAVAPFLRGYAPTELPPDGAYQPGALVSDAVALHEALGGDSDAVLIGHDWGAYAAYGAGSLAPDRFRRIVAMAVPPPAVTATAMASYDQVKRSFYMFVFQSPRAEAIVGGGDLAFLDRLWRDWSPGYDPTEDLRGVRAAIGAPERLRAAIGYYRAMLNPALHQDTYRDAQAALAAVAPQPTLYLHGERDGCLVVESPEAVLARLSPGSRAEFVADAGHFLHLEQAKDVNGRILDWLADRTDAGRAG